MHIISFMLLLIVSIKLITFGWKLKLVYNSTLLWTENKLPELLTIDASHQISNLFCYHVPSSEPTPEGPSVHPNAPPPHWPPSISLVPHLIGCPCPFVRLLVGLSPQWTTSHRFPISLFPLCNPGYTTLICRLIKWSRTSDRLDLFIPSASASLGHWNQLW